MLTHVKLFCLIGIASYIIGLNAISICRGCLDNHYHCRKHGDVWNIRKGNHQFTYRCSFSYTDGYETFRSEIIDAGCIIDGRVMRSGQGWFDQNRCANIVCVKSRTSGMMQVATQTKPGGCKVNGICRRNSETWYNGCTQFQCIVSGSMWQVRPIKYLPLCCWFIEAVMHTSTKYITDH